MVNFLRDNVSVFGFGRPLLLDIFDLSHPLFGRLPAPIGPSDPSDPFFVLELRHQMIQLEPVDPNIPSTQLGALIPQRNQPTIAQSLVHKTSQHTTTTPSMSINTTTFTTPISQSTSIPFNSVTSSFPQFSTSTLYASTSTIVHPP